MWDTCISILFVGVFVCQVVFRNIADTYGIFNDGTMRRVIKETLHVNARCQHNTHMIYIYIYCICVYVSDDICIFAYTCSTIMTQMQITIQYRFGDCACKQTRKKPTSQIVQWTICLCVSVFQDWAHFTGGQARSMGMHALFLAGRSGGSRPGKISSNKPTLVLCQMNPKKR